MSVSSSSMLMECGGKVASLVRATAWDPQNPYSLLVFPERAEGYDSHGGQDEDVGEGQGQQPMTVMPFRMLAKTGTVSSACNSHELKALMEMISAYERYHSERDESRRSHRRDSDTVVPFSLYEELTQNYRVAIRDCLDAWDAEISGIIDGDRGTSSENDEEQWNLLNQMYTVMRLADIYLPLQIATTTASLSSSSLYDLTDPLDIPGYVTAETVRFIRRHMLPSAEDAVTSTTETLTTVLDSKYPELDPLYWEYIMALVKRGCLDKAWKALTFHSLYEMMAGTSNETSNFRNGMDASDVHAGFDRLKIVLLSAPLPGGRTSDFDDQSPIDERTGEIDEVEIVGVPLSRDDCRLWDVTVDRSYENGPLHFNPNLVLSKYQTWREFVLQSRSACASLCHKIPQIDVILALLCGDFSNVTFSSWSERWCADLLYHSPHTRPRNMSRRAMYISSDAATTTVSEIDKALIHIMDGNAALAIVVMYNYGGGSGAALPSTLMALLFQAFVDATVIPPQLSSPLSDFIVDAASDIVASLRDTLNSDIGTQLAIRLLLPHLSPLSIVANERVEACICNILQHYTPSTDQYARTMVTLASRPLVEGMKSIQILDGCASIALYSHRKHMKYENAGTAALFLLDGIELEGSVLPQRTRGVCYRTLTAQCHVLSLQMLRLMTDKETKQVDSAMFEAASAIVKAFEVHDRVPNLQNIDAVAELRNVVSMFACKIQSTSPRETKADALVACLGKSECGSSDATPMSLHMPCLELAREITSKCHMGSVPVVTASLFNPSDVAVMMQRQIEQSMMSKKSNDDGDSEWRSLQRALTFAMFSENAKKAHRHPIAQSDSSRETTNVARNYANLEHMDAKARLHFVKTMINRK